MTILELIQAECRAKGINEKYAEKIQKIFKIEKEDGIGTYVSMFKDNLLSDIETAEKTKADAEKAAREAAIAEYEKAHNLKDGKPIEEGDAPEDKFKGLDPAIRQLIENQNKQLDDMKKLIEGNQKTIATTEKATKAKSLVSDAKLPESWLDRVNLDSEISLEDQVKALGDEYIKIQQTAIDEKVANGEYHVGSFQPKDRSEADWAKLMDSDVTPNNPGTVDLGLK
ncbi:hypothetical protein [Bacteroides ihuae]|uniref:hypothetical protein n=1 Tax=Bacteroides ihuae TaxID=1852362 RepID=UPI0008DB1269|nr:hypothetical protein [Bacteroides ihuae]